jgi:hypothetical protein
MFRLLFNGVIVTRLRGRDAETAYDTLHAIRERLIMIGILPIDNRLPDAKR